MSSEREIVSCYESRLASISQASCLCLQCARITDKPRHIWPHILSLLDGTA